MSANGPCRCLKPAVPELAKLFAIVSRLVCWALIPLAAVYKARIISSSFSYVEEQLVAYGYVTRGRSSDAVLSKSLLKTLSAFCIISAWRCTSTSCMVPYTESSFAPSREPSSTEAFAAIGFAPFAEKRFDPSAMRADLSAKSNDPTLPTITLPSELETEMLPSGETLTTPVGMVMLFWFASRTGSPWLVWRTPVEDREKEPSLV